jgi:hypothetical protein
MMAFGAGALLFAVTVELYAHALREVEKGRMGVLDMFVIIFGALCGAAFYLTANQWLKEAFPEGEESARESEAIVSPRTNDAIANETTPLLKAALLAEQKAKAERHEAEGKLKQAEASAPMIAALKHAEKDEERRKNVHVPTISEDSVEVTRQTSEEKAKAAWGKLATKKRKAISLLKTDAWSFERPRELAIRAAVEDTDGEDGKKGLTVALGIFLGLLVDGLPEGILMGFLSAEGHLTPVLIVSLFMANLPEAFASGSLMVLAGLSTPQIMGLWSGLCLLVGSLCGLSCYLLLLYFPSYGVHGAHGGGHGEGLPLSILLSIALVEGITGGAMIACISSVMLPEAYANCDKDKHQFLHQTGFLATVGFLLSVALKTLFG